MPTSALQLGVVQDPELTPAGVGVFQQEPDQEWLFLIRTGSGVGVIFSRVF